MNCEGLHSFSSFFCFWWDWGLNTELCTCKAGALQFGPHLQSILLWLFWRWGFTNSLPRLALNHDLPDLSLQVAMITGISHQCPEVCSVWKQCELFSLTLVNKVHISCLYIRDNTIFKMLSKMLSFFSF
jgi:hypothetical protein